MDSDADLLYAEAWPPLASFHRPSMISFSNGYPLTVRRSKWPLRCRIVLAAAEGQSDVSIAEQLSVNRKTVILWRSRFSEQRLEGLWEIAPGRGRKPTYDIDKIASVVEATLQTKPAGMSHWSCRTMAKSQGVSKSTVNYIWQAHNLKPHLVETFKLSRDPKFLEKMTDVVGLYLNPPQQAIVLCVDEKSQIQALDRTQPGLPIKKGRCGTMTHDYKRNGTTTLFAALSMLDGKVIGDCMPRHRHQEFIRFLNKIDAETPSHLDLHLIVDNYATHKHPRVKSWIRRHPRFHFHFIPTSSSWLNLVERWFREITDKRIRRGSFHNVTQLIAAIEDYLKSHNQNPRVFVWKAAADSIMTKIAKCKEALGTLH